MVVTAMNSAFCVYSDKDWCKGWLLHYRKTYDSEIWYAGTYRRFDSLATKNAGTSDVIALKLRDFENLL